MLTTAVRRYLIINKFRQSAADNRVVCRSMASAASTDRFKLIFFVPPTHLPQCKEAIFATGAGRYPGPGNYTEACFITPGVGQFRPGESAKPAIGEAGKLEEVGEVRCETICVGREVAKAAVEALKKAHPYEEAAYEVYKMEDL